MNTHFISDLTRSKDFFKVYDLTTFYGTKRIFETCKNASDVFKKLNYIKNNQYFEKWLKTELATYYDNRKINFNDFIITYTSDSKQYNYNPVVIIELTRESVEWETLRKPTKARG